MNPLEFQNDGMEHILAHQTLTSTDHPVDYPSTIQNTLFSIATVFPTLRFNINIFPFLFY
ncbi:hypothetical protein PGH45_19005 [Legionella pneumophila]|nr:hypothetical protein [Legionella pneumophila]